MKIGIIEIEGGKIPNIALEKIKMYHKQRKNKIIENPSFCFSLSKQLDKIYVSTIFDWNKRKAEKWEKLNAEIGGSGYDITKKLPPEIEEMKPKINYGFTSRGCNRKCLFCIVPQKEGKLRAIGNIYDFWDEKSKYIVLFDNNILALPKHFYKICGQIKKENLQVDFNQGLDIRLVTDNIAKELKSLRHKMQIRLAWDEMCYEKQFDKGIKVLLKYFKPRRFMIYMLIAYNTSYEEDVYRLNKIRKYGCDVFVMIYNKKGNKLQKEFARWNNRFYLRSLPFETYLEVRGYSYLLKVKNNYW